MTATTRRSAGIICVILATIFGIVKLMDPATATFPTYVFVFSILIIGIVLIVLSRKSA